MDISLALFLVRLNGKLVGFNLVQLVACEPSELNEEHVIIHQVKLTVSQLSGERYSNFNFFMVHHRSFLPLSYAINVKLITVAEIASAAGMAQAAAFEHYPMLGNLQKYIPLVQNTIYKKICAENKLVYDPKHDLWYMHDPLATFKRREISAWESIWRDRTGLTLDRYFKSSIFQQNTSIIIIYEGNTENYKKFTEKLKNTFKPDDIIVKSNTRYQANL